jgi:hypothetical protein
MLNTNRFKRLIVACSNTLKYSIIGNEFIPLWDLHLQWSLESYTKDELPDYLSEKKGDYQNDK